MGTLANVDGTISVKLDAQVCASCAGSRCSCFACGRRPSRAAREDRPHADAIGKAAVCAERMEQRSLEVQGAPKERPKIQWWHPPWPASLGWAEGRMSASLGCAARGGGACPRSAARSQPAADDRAKASGAQRRSVFPDRSSRVTGRSHATAPRRRRRPTGSCAAGGVLHWQGRRGSARCRARTSPRPTGRCRRAWMAGRRARPLHEAEQLSATPTPLVACAHDSALIRAASARAATAAAAAADGGRARGAPKVCVRRS